MVTCLSIEYSGRYSGRRPSGCRISKAFYCYLNYILLSLSVKWYADMISSYWNISTKPTTQSFHFDCRCTVISDYSIIVRMKKTCYLYAEDVPHVAKFIHAFCSTFSLGPSPFKILYPPLSSQLNHFSVFQFDTLFTCGDLLQHGLLLMTASGLRIHDTFISKTTGTTSSTFIPIKYWPAATNMLAVTVVWVTD